MTTGSSLWQTIFVSFALILIAFEIVRGWRLGLVRQLVRLLAVLAAYAAGFFGGRMLLPVLRHFIQAPDLILSVVSGAVLALVVYALITGVGAVLFKRTGQQSVGMVRFLYGVSGAALGVLFGLLSVWLIVVGVRSVGAIANAEVRSGRPPPNQPAFTRSAIAARPAAPPSFVASLAKLKNSIELGSLGDLVKSVDVVPANTYQALGKLGAVVSDPHSAARFLSYPGGRTIDPECEDHRAARRP
ncbi:MAG: CvpA family protein [Chthoniobacterales bacterium]|nr:CvpA family protein [Chthoniobacterales bacterium]